MKKQECFVIILESYLYLKGEILRDPKNFSYLLDGSTTR